MKFHKPWYRETTTISLFANGKRAGGLYSVVVRDNGRVVWTKALHDKRKLRNRLREQRWIR